MYIYFSIICGIITLFYVTAADLGAYYLRIQVPMYYLPRVIFVIVVLCTGCLYQQNTYVRETKTERKTHTHTHGHAV